LQRAFNKAARWVFRNKKTSITAEDLNEESVQPLINGVNSVLQDGFNRGIAYNVPSAMKRSLSENVFIFSGAKTQRELKELSGLLLDGDKVRPFNEFWKEAQKIHATYNKTYLEAEYIFTTQSAQMASKWSEYEEDGDRYNLQYRTAYDERVRELHQPLHDITLPLIDSFWDRYFPPNGWRCRCTAVQVRKSKYPESNSEQAQKLGNQATQGRDTLFRFNLGKQKKIYPDDHPYTEVLNKTEKRILETKSAVYVRDAEDVIEKKFKSGGVLQMPKDFQQNKQEEAKNILAYTLLAKHYGEKYRLLSVINKHKVKNPDALNLLTGKHSDVKIPISNNGKNAIQNSIKEASKQRVSEAYIYLDKEYRMQDIWAGLKSSLQKGRAETIETIIIRLKSGEVKRYDTNKLREVFVK